MEKSGIWENISEMPGIRNWSLDQSHEAVKARGRRELPQKWPQRVEEPELDVHVERLLLPPPLSL
jgi:hypothetical protein